MKEYSNLKQPFLAPPSWVFTVVWAILFILMGISAYRIYIARAETTKTALTLYLLQLAMNFFWSIIYFNMKAYLFAFFWLVVLWLLILFMIIAFRKIDKPAAYLQIPYLVWVAFAGYLNLAIYFLNK